MLYSHKNSHPLRRIKHEIAIAVMKWRRGWAGPKSDFRKKYFKLLSPKLSSHRNQIWWWVGNTTCHILFPTKHKLVGETITSYYISTHRELSRKARLVHRIQCQPFTNPLTIWLSKWGILQWVKRHQDEVIFESIFWTLKC